MFPLAGTQIPSSADELSRAIRTALQDVFTRPAGGQAVTISGALPSLEQLRINLDGAMVTATKPPSKPEPASQRERGITVERLEVSGRPIRFEGNQAEFGMRARGVQLDYARDTSGRPMLVPVSARDGDVEIAITKANLEAILLNSANMAAKAQGAAVQEVNINLTSAGPRSVTAEVRVKAKKMIMSGVIRLSARIDIDDALVATVSHLGCTGEGMVGNMVAGMLQGKLKEYEATRFPLSSFALGELRLRDLRIDTADGLRVHASFGSEGAIA